MTPKQQVKAASTSLVLDQPFFGSLALRLNIVEDPGCGTAWTDGTSLGYDPAFIATLSMDETLGLIAHEVLHCANGHPWRRDGREPRQFNVAADYAINYILGESGFKLPEGALRSAQFDGKSAEWIYARIPPQPPRGGGKKPGQGPGSGPGDEPGPGQGGQDVRDAKTGPAAGDGNSEADWQQAVQQAAQAAKMRGKLPASLARFAKLAATPKVDWRSVLHRFVQQAAKDDYTWRMPNTRYLPGGLYLPSLKSESMGPLAIAVDTSGSIDDVVLSQFAAEIRAVVDEARPSKVYVAYADAKVHRVDEFEAGDPVELHPVGGGGTAFAPVMDWVDGLDEQPVALIFLTDLEGSFRKEPPAAPLLWASIGSAEEVPYGELVRVE